MKDKDLSFLDRFLYKLFIGFFLLLLVVVLDHYHVFGFEYQTLKAEVSQQFNFLKVVEAINGKTNALIPLELDSDKTVSGSTFLEIKDIENGKRMILGDYEAVECIKLGVVVKIGQHSDGTYEVVVKGIDDLEYHYDMLESIDVNIYQLVNGTDIIGKSSFNGTNYYDLYIFDKDQVVDYYS